MNYLAQDAQPNRRLTIHGPPGVDVSRLLAQHSVRLRRDDIIIIEECDDCVETWVESAWEADPLGHASLVVRLES